MNATRAKVIKDLKVMIRFRCSAGEVVQGWPRKYQGKVENEGAPGSTDVVWNRKEERKRKRGERKLGGESMSMSCL